MACNMAKETCPTMLHGSDHVTWLLPCFPYDFSRDDDSSREIQADIDS
jgi:hypothetical protein